MSAIHARNNADLVRRLMHSIVVTESGCWEWTSTTDRDGYGRTTAPGVRHIRAHRLSWWLRHGDPGDLRVLHRCDNPPCINPAHLFLGTVTDNVRDCVAKGRASNGTRRGEASHWARLTAAQVAAIRERVAGGEKQSEVADDLGIDGSHVSRIVNGHRWSTDAA